MALSGRNAAEAEAEKEETARDEQDGVETTSTFQSIAGEKEVEPRAPVVRVQAAITEAARKHRTGAEERAIQQAAEEVVVAAMQVECMETARV